MKIANNLILPLKSCKGSVAQRHNQAEQILENFVQLADSKIEQHGSISLSLAKKLILRCLPSKKIKLEIFRSEDEDSNFGVHADENNYVDKLFMELKTDKNGRIGEEEKNDLYHETWHFLSYILNPKEIARFSAIDADNLYEYENFYHKNFYTFKKHKPKFLTNKLNKFLAKFDDTDKINILQLLRSDLKSELFAFTLAEKHAPMLSPIHKKFHFPMKLSLAENYLRKLLLDLRSKQTK